MLLIKRFIRWFRVFLAIRRIRKANSSTAERTAKKALATLMANNRGLSMKIGQVMAGMQDDNDFSALTSSITPWPLHRIMPVLEANWQQGSKQVLSHIEESQAAASLGQVHLAQLITGEKVAIKVQYPDIAKAIHSEINMINMLPSVGPVKRWDFDLAAYKQNLHDNMQRELDYQCEIQHQIEMKQKINIEGLHIPKVYPALSSSVLIVQDWVDGVRLQEASHWPLLDRLHLGRTLITTLFQSLFSIGLVHGDPHPGNMLFQETTPPTVTMLDFGCMIRIEPQRSLALLKLILSLRGECQQSILDAFVALGFQAEKLLCIQSQLPQLALILFQPFIENKACDVEHWHPGKEIEEALQEQRWWFRAAGPADLFLLMRVFQGLIQQLHTLQVKLPWWPLLKQSLSSERMAQARHLKIPPVSGAAQQDESSPVKHLYINIHKQHEPAQCLTFDAIAVLHLESLIPKHVLLELKNHAIDIQDISQQFQKNGLHAKKLFDLHINQNHYSAWVE